MLGGGVLEHGDLRIDVPNRRALLAGKVLRLTRTEFDLLCALASQPSRDWSRVDLMQRVWHTDWVGDGHLLEVHVGNLRRKLGAGARGYVRTVRGVGYRLAPN
jgi:DNA-binding response OmpR family regulator